MSKPRLMIVPGDALPPGSPADAIPTQRAMQMPTTREQIGMALKLAGAAYRAAEQHQQVIGALHALLERACYHIKLLEVATGVAPDKHLDAEIKAQLEAAQRAQQERLNQPPPQGENLIDPPPGELSIGQLVEAMDDHARNLNLPSVAMHLLTENEKGERQWITREQVMNDPLPGAPLKIGPKPPTQGIGFAGARVPRVSDPDVPAPAIQQPPECPA